MELPGIPGSQHGGFISIRAGRLDPYAAPASNSEVTDVWFAIRGANLNLDEQGKVESVLDAGAVLEIYLARCEASGHRRPNVIGT